MIYNNTAMSCFMQYNSCIPAVNFFCGQPFIGVDCNVLNLIDQRSGLRYFGKTRGHVRRTTSWVNT